MYEVSVSATFSAAHRLRGYKGRCEKLHGHNWRVGVFVQSASLNEEGMVVDFTILKEILKKVISKLDHTYLNELPFFKKANPTSEKIARFIFDEISRHLGTSPKVSHSTKLKEVAVWETETSRASFGV